MKLKTVEVNGKTYAEIVDGKPVFVTDDNKEIPFDVPQAVGKISQLNGEAKTHREAKEAAEAKLAGFAGITDPAAALTALETVKNIKDGELIAAGKVAEIKAAAQQAAEERVAQGLKAAGEKLTLTEKERDDLRGQLHGQMKGAAFARSKFIQDKLILPPDLAQKVFDAQFEVKDGKLIGKDSAGNPVYSRAKPGEIAEFDEAIELIVEAYPQKDTILKGDNRRGDGKQTNGGGNGSGGKQMTRAEFNKLSPGEQMAAMRPTAQGAVPVTVVD